MRLGLANVELRIGHLSDRPQSVVDVPGKRAAKRRSEEDQLERTAEKASAFAPKHDAHVSCELHAEGRRASNDQCHQTAIVANLARSAGDEGLFERKRRDKTARAKLDELK